MINENIVVQLLTIHLKNNGYEIIQSLDTDSTGVDIIANNTKTQQRLFVEVKGETSSKKHTKRFGKPFNQKQIRTHVAKAVLAAMRIVSSKPAGQKTRAGVAFPLTERHQKELETIKPAIKRLNIKIFWIGEKKVIEE